MRPYGKLYYSSLRYRCILVLFLLFATSWDMCYAFRVRSRGIAPEEYSQNSGPANYFICEFGIFGGGSYYLGDATEHIFNDIRPAYGAMFRYNLTRRWSFTAKATYSDFKFDYYTKQEQPLAEGEVFVAEKRYGSNNLVMVDVTAEYNFFELARGWVNRSTKPFSPYIFLGLGISWQKNGNNHISGYLPLGIGFKWLMTPRSTLSFAWQHQLYFNDKLEGVGSMNDFWGLNGSNFFHNDIFSTFTLGITVNFAQRKRVCKVCGN